MSLLNLKLGQVHLVVGTQRFLLLVSERVLSGSLLQLSQCESHLSTVLVLSTLCRVEEVNTDWLFDIITSQIGCQEVDHVELVSTTFCCLNL